MILRGLIKLLIVTIIDAILEEKLMNTSVNIQKRLYVLISKDLTPVYGCVQGGHAVAQYLLEHPKQNWNNQYLIYLYANVNTWKRKLDMFGLDYSSFREPDLDNALTAIAVEDDGKMFKNLKLVE